MVRGKQINNFLMKQRMGHYEVYEPTTVVGRHPSGYTKIADFTRQEYAIMFMETNLSCVSTITKKRKTTKWIAMGF
jgi:hypothetical protein